MTASALLAPLNTARTALSQATTVADFRAVRDAAAAAKTYIRARRLGIDAENESTEVILRAERGIGQAIIDAREQGLLHVEGRPSKLSADDGVLTVAQFTDMPSHDKRPWEWQLAAAVPPESFEAMLTEARANVERLSKVNFYREGRKARGMTEQPTDESPDFALFRRGAHALLGWKVDDDGAGHATANGLLQLPNDELLQLRSLVQALAVAYTEAVGARQEKKQ